MFPRSMITQTWQTKLYALMTKVRVLFLPKHLNVGSAVNGL